MYAKLFSPASQRIITALLDGRRSLGELAAELGLAKSTLQQKHLHPLEELGVVAKQLVKSERGREAFYELQRFTLHVSLDPHSASGLVIATGADFAPTDLLLEQLEKGEFKEDLKLLVRAVSRMAENEQPNYIILFGSVARGEGAWKSDIDILLLHRVWKKENKDVFMEIIAEVTMQTRHQIKPHFQTLLEFEGGDSLLCDEIKQSGIIIYGDRFGRPSLWKKMNRYASITL